SNNWEYSARRCRTLTSIGFSPVVWQAITAETQRIWKKDDRVYFRSGNKVTSESQTKQREKLERISVASLERAKEPQKRVIQYRLGQPSNKFMREARKNAEKAHAAADLLPYESQRQSTHMLIETILSQPKPLYQPSKRGKTMRVFGIGDSFLTLPSNIRH